VLALFSNTLGTANAASGDFALYSNTTGDDNTADGHFALFHNSTGARNTATGRGALYGNTTGEANTASGYDSPGRTTTGGGNTGMGAYALAGNTSGSSNTAIGEFALHDAFSGIGNTASGASSLQSDTTGGNNTASGFDALRNNTTGSGNIALGESAGLNLTTGSNNIDIGNGGVAGEAATIRIGAGSVHTAAYVAGISGATVADGVGVVIDSEGHLGTVTSSARYKDAIRPMQQQSEAILGLQPVTFRYKRELDPKGIPQFGLVAEQVEKVDPDLVARDGQGKAYTVRYEAVNAMLLNEFLKAHRKIEEQAAINRQQEAAIARLDTALKEQAAQIERVSSRVAADESASRLLVSH
jgi:hypothetical protein